MPTDQTAVSQKVQDGELFYVTPRTTIALDTVTGAERWRVDGDAQPVIAAGVAIVAEHDARNQIVGLRVVKLGDGATVWRLALPPLADWTPLPGWDHPEAIATIAQDGTAAVYDFADGTLRRSARLFGNDAHVVRGQTGVEPAGDNFAVVRDALEDGSVSTIYSADTMKALWQTGYVAPCGTLLCSTGRGGVSGHDPATGRVIWALTGASDGWQVGENRMVVGKRDNTELQLIDSRTGRSLGRPITGMVASGSGLADELLITRPSLDPVGELVVTRVDLADGTQTPLGRFGPSGEQTVCSTSREYLACPRYDGLHVMAVGP
jgi:hypothetical protein